MSTRIFAADIDTLGSIPDEAKSIKVPSALTKSNAAKTRVTAMEGGAFTRSSARVEELRIGMTTEQVRPSGRADAHGSGRNCRRPVRHLVVRGLSIRALR